MDDDFDDELDDDAFNQLVTQSQFSFSQEKENTKRGK